MPYINGRFVYTIRTVRHCERTEHVGKICAQHTADLLYVKFSVQLHCELNN